MPRGSLAPSVHLAPAAAAARNRVAAHRRRGTVAVVALVSLLALGACGSDGDSDGTASNGGGSTSTSTTVASSDAPASDLDGRTFTSTSVTGHELVADTEVRLSFEDGRLAAAAGCNTLVGPYSFADGSLGWDGDPAATMMACDPELQAQDEWLTTFLTEGADAELDGDSLVLTSGEVTIDLEAAASETPSLLGTSWTLDSTSTADGAATVPDGVEPATLAIADDGSVSLFTGCNTGRSSVEQDGETLVFEGAAITRMACQGGGSDLEKIVLAVLDGETKAVVETDALVITKGDQSLVFRAS